MNYPDYLETALSNPNNFTIEIVKMDSLDWEDPNKFYYRVYIYPFPYPKNYKDYSIVDYPEDVEKIIDVFEEKNPKNIDRSNQYW